MGVISLLKKAVKAFLVVTAVIGLIIVLIPFAIVNWALSEEVEA